MPTESDLRRLLQGEPDPAQSLDVDRIIRRARARRRPRQLAAGATGVLAAAALVVPVSVGASLSTASGPAEDSAGGGEAAVMMDERAGGDRQEAGLEPLADAQVCGAEGVRRVEHPDGLELAVVGAQGSGSATTTVDLELRNRGDAAFVGAIAPAAVGLLADGAVVAANAPEEAEWIAVDLAPGAALPLRAELPLTACGGDEPGAELPAVAYEIGAVLRTERSDGSLGIAGAWPLAFEIAGR